MSKKGYKQTEEHKRKRSAALMGHSISKETRKKISQSLKGNRNALGSKRSEEFKQKCRDYYKKNPFKHTEKAKKKIGQASKGNQYALGCKRSDEFKKRVSNTLKEKYRSGQLVPVNKGIVGVYHHTEEAKKKLRTARLKQTLPQNGTKIELMLRAELDKLNIYYETNVPVCGICKPDIVLQDIKLAIFADGDYWHSKKFGSGKRWNRDRKIDQGLQDDGWTSLRFWGSEIKGNTTKCVKQILTVSHELRTTATHTGDILG